MPPSTPICFAANWSHQDSSNRLAMIVDAIMAPHNVMVGIVENPNLKLNTEHPMNGMNCEAFSHVGYL